MKASTKYLLGAIVFLLVSAYLILSTEPVWHSAVVIALTFVAGVVYTIYGIREKLTESSTARASSVK